VDRLFPFTGGSRFIQNGVMSPRQMLVYALVLFGAVIAGGLWLIATRGSGLFWIGIAGLLIGWAYSAPPLKLNSRGLGEICVAAGFLLIVAGADFVQRGTMSLTPWLIGLPYALLVTNILYVNQFPDRNADLQAGKRHWVVRLEPSIAARGYWLILALAVLVQVWLVASGRLPVLTLISLLALIPALKAGQVLSAHAAEPAKLAPAVQMTILAAHLQPVLLSAALVWTLLA
jgi:1,4-dihydroxy-2-naphthoate octaprenyltransferase